MCESCNDPVKLKGINDILRKQNTRLRNQNERLEMKIEQLEKELSGCSDFTEFQAEMNEKHIEMMENDPDLEKVLDNIDMVLADLIFNDFMNYIKSELGEVD